MRGREKRGARQRHGFSLEGAKSYGLLAPSAYKQQSRKEIKFLSVIDKKQVKYKKQVKLSNISQMESDSATALPPTTHG